MNNTGTAPLDITEIDAGGDYSEPSDTCIDLDRRGRQLHDRCRLHPSVAGTDNGSLMLTDNAADSPETLQLTGSGTRPEAVLSSSPVNFGTVVIGSSDQEVLTVSNPGTATLDLSGAALSSGTDSGDFALAGVTSGCVGSPPTILPGTSCGVEITFTPGGTGTRSATLTLTDNASPATQAVTLTGIGAPAH